MITRSPREHGSPNWFFALGSIAVAFSCVVAAAYLAFDWADYGIDSTCGNLVTNRKWNGPPCSDIMRNRTIAVVALLITAVAVMLAVWWWPRRRRHT